MAAEGRTVLVSSHLMSEMALTADHLIIIGRGRLLADTSTAQFVSGTAPGRAGRSRPGPRSSPGCSPPRGAAVSPEDGGGLAVTGLDAPAIGDLAAGARHRRASSWSPRHASLEEAYLDLTGGQHRVPRRSPAPEAGRPPQ